MWGDIIMIMIGLQERQGGLVVKRPPGNQKVGGSNPTTATW